MTAIAGRRQARLSHRQRQARRLQACALLALCMLPVAAALAAPSVFPTGVTRYEPQKAWNGHVLFSDQDKKTHLIDMNGANLAQRHPDVFNRLKGEWEAWSASMLPITPDVRTHGVNGKVQADHYHADGTD